MTEYCECCGARIVRYWHRLNRHICAALIRSYNHRQLTAFMIREIPLSHEQICNFQKLKYWGLIEKAEESKWRITLTGEQFIKGQITVPSRVQTFRDKPVAQDQDQIKISEVIEGYQWREDYRNEAE